MRQKEKAVKYFDDHAIDYNKAYRDDSDLNLRSFLLNERRCIVLNLVKGKQGRVLDVGCGPAILAEGLLEQKFNVWGIDPSRKMIDIGKKRLSNPHAKKLHLAVGEAEELNFSNSSFDIVICLGVLEYLENPVKAIKEMDRVLKKNGRLIVSFPNAVSPFNLIDFSLLVLFRYFVQIARLLFKLAGRELKMNPKRILLSGSIESRKYSAWKIKKILKLMDYEKFTVKYHGYRFAFMKAFLQKTVICLNRTIGFGHSPLVWFGINCIVCAEKN